MSLYILYNKQTRFTTKSKMRNFSRTKRKTYQNEKNAFFWLVLLVVVLLISFSRVFVSNLLFHEAIAHRAVYFSL